MDQQHRDIIEKCLRITGSILRGQFGLPVQKKSSLHSKEFVIFIKRNRTLFVHVGRVIDDHTLDEVRQLCDQSDRHDFDPDVFIQTISNGIVNRTLMFEVTSSEDGTERIAVISDLASGKTYEPVLIHRSTYGYEFQPGWGDFQEGKIFFYPN